MIELSSCFNGGQGQNRTADTGIFSPLLYRLSYLAMCEGVFEFGGFWNQSGMPSCRGTKAGWIIT